MSISPVEKVKKKLAAISSDSFNALNKDSCKGVV
jgi:hypothetical protein